MKKDREMNIFSYLSPNGSRKHNIYAQDDAHKVDGVQWPVEYEVDAQGF